MYLSVSCSCIVDVVLAKSRDIFEFAVLSRGILIFFNPSLTLITFDIRHSKFCIVTYSSVLVIAIRDCSDTQKYRLANNTLPPLRIFVCRNP